MRGKSDYKDNEGSVVLTPDNLFSVKMKSFYSRYFKSFLFKFLLFIPLLIYIKVKISFFNYLNLTIITFIFFAVHTYIEQKKQLTSIKFDKKKIIIEYSIYNKQYEEYFDISEVDIVYDIRGGMKTVAWIKIISESGFKIKQKNINGWKEPALESIYHKYKQLKKFHVNTI